MIRIFPYLILIILSGINNKKAPIKKNKGRFNKIYQFTAIVVFFYQYVFDTGS